MPWVLRALGPAAFGKFAFYQAIVQYFTIIVEFGFPLTATRRIAELRGEVEAASRYFWTVQGAKLVLAGIALVAALGLWLVVPGFRNDGRLLAASLVVLIGTVITPMWLFMGNERMGLVSIAAVGARLATIPAMLLLVRGPGDAWIAALVTSAGVVASGLIALLLIRANRLLSGWHPPRVGDMLEAYRDAWPLFVSNSATSLYSATNPVLLGAISGTVQVGLFSAADRIRQISLGPISPVVNAFYPNISRRLVEDRGAALRVFRRVLLVFAIGMGLVSIALVLLAPLIVHTMMGPQFAGSIPVLRIMALVPILVGINSALGTLAMLPLGMKRAYTAILLLCGLGNLGLLAGLAGRWGAAGAATALVLTELVVTTSMAVVLARKGVFRA